MPPSPAPTATLRRREDVVLADFDKRLALIEQGADLHAKANEARQTSLQHGLDLLTAEVRTALSLIATATADPAASPMGRQLLASDNDLRRQLDDERQVVDSHDRFIAEARGALRLARFALGTSFLAVLGNIALGLIYLSASHP